jgi:uncharacterized integral membrane protein
MHKFKLIVAGILAILILIVVLQNTASVETKILMITLTMPRAVLLIVTLLIGFLIGVLSSSRLKKKRAGD